MRVGGGDEGGSGLGGGTDGDSCAFEVLTRWLRGWCWVWACASGTFGVDVVGGERNPNSHGICNAKNRKVQARI
jgi:hypothetical protein